MRSHWWGTLSVPLFLWAAALGAASADPFSLREERRGNQTLLWAENADDFATRWAWIELQAEQNLHSLPALPLGVALGPHEKRLVATFSAQDPAQGWSYALRSRSGVGDPTREPDRSVIYLLPYAHGTKHTVTQGYFGRVTHQSVRALDFDLNTGTPIHAARAGTVIVVKQDSDRGGPGPEYDRFDNTVQVMHADATWAVYAHLQLNGARVQLGQHVEAGDQLGLSGATGMASGPHLHFEVDQAGWDKPLSVATVFKTGVSETASLEEGKTYYAYVPGGPAFRPVLGADLKDEDLRAVTRTASGGKVRIRQQRVDQKDLVYCANGSGRSVDVVVGFSQQSGVRPSTGLPYRATIPAHTEVYLFAVDFLGGQQREGYGLTMKVAWSQ